ncbi:MAG TPA: TMEM175 family protein [Candidatus Baltobacteraceae bacterium]|nr:TMEM175 family protein [Candidatus Baltobacteraceae bacterium]
MSGFREESEERLVHRLEAFSDIVIAFSLAQMTLSLTLTADPLQLFTTGYVTLVGFGLTFLVVCGMWWAHHRLFTHFFYPTTVNIILNFLSLAGVLLLVYALQLWLHATVHKWVAYTMYTGAVAWVLGLNAILTYRGIALRGEHLPAELAERGKHRAIGQGIMAVAFALSTAWDVRTQTFGRAESTLILALLALGFGAARFIQRRRSSATRSAV